MKRKELQVRKVHSFVFFKRGSAATVLPLFLKAGLSFLFAVLILNCCSTPAEIKREASLSEKPGWIKNPPHSEDTLYFIGISTSSETLELGRKEALKAAISEISNYMGSRVESVFQSYITEIERDLSIQMKSESAALVKGAKVVDSYYEKMVRIDKNFRMERYDVYLLVSFSLKEVEKELIRQNKEKLDKVNTAFKYYMTGLSHEKRREYHSSRRSFNQAMGLIAEIKDVVEVNDKEIKNSEDLKLRLETHLQYVITQLLKISLSINIRGPEQGKKAFLSSFGSSLGERGFTITNKKPAFEIKGDVSVSKSSYIMHNYVYYAEGSVSAERTSDHQVVATYPFQVKGFHRLKAQAALNALVDAGAEAGSAISEKIIEREKIESKESWHRGPGFGLPLERAFSDSRR